MQGAAATVHHQSAVVGRSALDRTHIMKLNANAQPTSAQKLTHRENAIVSFLFVRH